MNRRQALVDAAFARVATGGFEGLRLRQVADDVGIDHSTLHHHFRTKQDLILEVAAYTTRQFWSTAPTAKDPAQGLHQHLSALRARMASWPELFVVSVELDLRARRDDGVREALDAYEAGWRAALTGLFAAGRDDGTWPGLDPVTAAELVIATVKGARHASRHAGPVFDQLEKLLTRREPPCTS